LFGEVFHFNFQNSKSGNTIIGVCSKRRYSNFVFPLCFYFPGCLKPAHHSISLNKALAKFREMSSAHASRHVFTGHPHRAAQMPAHLGSPMSANRSTHKHAEMEWQCFSFSFSYILYSLFFIFFFNMSELVSRFLCCLLLGSLRFCFTANRKVHELRQQNHQTI